MNFRTARKVTTICAVGMVIGLVAAWLCFPPDTKGGVARYDASWVLPIILFVVAILLMLAALVIEFLFARCDACGTYIGFRVGWFASYGVCYCPFCGCEL
ncbi:MAG: hypothetical protein FWC46_03985 [Actinomycetia bacterium]|nr:hypothetical protein [Actinomycetes bacterium]